MKLAHSSLGIVLAMAGISTTAAAAAAIHGEWIVLIEATATATGAVEEQVPYNSPEDWNFSSGHKFTSSLGYKGTWSKEGSKFRVECAPSMKKLIEKKGIGPVPGLKVPYWTYKRIKVEPSAAGMGGKLAGLVKFKLDGQKVKVRYMGLFAGES